MNIRATGKEWERLTLKEIPSIFVKGVKRSFLFEESMDSDLGYAYISCGLDIPIRQRKIILANDLRIDPNADLFVYHRGKKRWTDLNFYKGGIADNLSCKSWASFCEEIQLFSQPIFGLHVMLRY